IAIAILIAIVVSSYRQTIHAYPQGGGAYIVSKDNLGTFAGLVAGAALLIDYVLTVAVSVAAGVAAVTSAVPVLFRHRVWLCVAAVVLVALANLRGIRESGELFAAPTWLGAILITLFLGITVLAYDFGISPRPEETVVSQLARHVFGTSPLYYLTQAGTALILLLAANTSFADFPRLSFFLARDRFIPR